MNVKQFRRYATTFADGEREALLSYNTWVGIALFKERTVFVNNERLSADGERNVKTWLRAYKDFTIVDVTLSNLVSLVGVHLQLTTHSTTT